MAAPYNPQNALLSEEGVLGILQLRSMPRDPQDPRRDPRRDLQDLRPRDPGLYQRAFAHKSFCACSHEQWLRSQQQQQQQQQQQRAGRGQPRQHSPHVAPLQPESNLKLEWLGDSVLQLLVTELLLERHPGPPEGDAAVGQLAGLRARIVCNEALGRLMRDMGWHAHLLMDVNLEGMGGRGNTQLLADCFEALVGAVYTDLGHAACRRWLAALLGERLGSCSPLPGVTAAGVGDTAAAAAAAPGLPAPGLHGPATVAAASAQQQQQQEQEQGQGQGQAITFDAVANRFSDGAELSWSVRDDSKYASLVDPDDTDPARRRLTPQHLQAPVVRPEQLRTLHLPTGTPRSFPVTLAEGQLTMCGLMDTVAAVYRAYPGMLRSLQLQNIDPSDDFYTSPGRDAHPQRPFQAPVALWPGATWRGVRGHSRRLVANGCRCLLTAKATSERCFTLTSSGASGWGERGWCLAVACHAQP